MTMPLHAAATPEQLVPDDVAALRALAQAADGVAEGARQVTGLLSQIQTGKWQGRAADAYRAAALGLPGPYDAASWAFTAAGTTLRRYAEAVERTRVAVARAIELLQAADLLTDRWQRDNATDPLSVFPGLAIGSAPRRGRTPAEDPGHVVREQALRLYDGAQADLALEAARTVEALRHGAGAAPRGRTAFEQLARVAQGSVDSITDTAALVWAFTPPAMALDPEQALRTRQDVGEGVKQAVLHPEQTYRAVQEQWRDDPAYEIGRALPDLVLEGLTGGAAVAAVAGRSALRASMRDLEPSVAAAVAADRALRLFLRHESQKIAEQAFDERPCEGGNFPGITTQEQFRAYIEGVMSDPDDSFFMPGRGLYWDEGRRAIVIQQGDGPGTAYVPSSGKAAFDEEVRKARLLVQGPVAD